MTLLTANETLHVIVNTHYKEHLERIQKLINEAIEKDHGAIAVPRFGMPGPVRAYLRNLGYSERVVFQSPDSNKVKAFAHYIYDIYT